MIFQQEETDLAERLYCRGGTIKMKKGVNNYFKVTFVNSSDHDIILKKNMIMGRVEPINSSVPLKLNYIKIVSIKAIWKNTEEVQVTEEQQKSDSNSMPMNMPTVERKQKILPNIEKMRNEKCHQRRLGSIFRERDDDVAENLSNGNQL